MPFSVVGLACAIADIAMLDVEAIFKVASAPVPGSSGASAIHRDAGPGVLVESRSLAEVYPGVRCPTGQAVLSGGGALEARRIKWRAWTFCSNLPQDSK